MPGLLKSGGVVFGVVDLLGGFEEVSLPPGYSGISYMYFFGCWGKQT